MRALDGYCCAGGVSDGLRKAGFETTGLDVEEQPEYPRQDLFVRDSFLECSPTWLRQFDFIWASPPCQFATAYKRRTDHVRPAMNLIPQTRELLESLGVPYCIENVEGARDHLRNPFTLCGSMFGLDVQRHRCFETNFPVSVPTCDHSVWEPRFPGATNRKPNSRKTVEVGVYRIPIEVQRKAMGRRAPGVVTQAFADGPAGLRGMDRPRREATPHDEDEGSVKRKKRCLWCERASKAQGLGSCVPCTAKWERDVRKRLRGMREATPR
jgi:DNA (cytosine-5)-methyltransferase 1